LEVRDSEASEWKDACSSEEVAVVALIRDRTYASSGASVLVRIQPDAEGNWLDSLPAVPDGAIVSVSATSALITEHAEALGALGYVVAGAFPTGGGDTVTDLVDLVVPTDLIEDDPGWWRHVRAIAWRALPVMHGPVARVHAQLLGRHDVARRGHAGLT
jgi:hypothetical protein